MAGSAPRTSSAGRTGRGAKTRHAIRLTPDHSIGAGQIRAAKLPKGPAIHPSDRD